MLHFLQTQRESFLFKVSEQKRLLAQEVASPKSRKQLKVSLKILRKAYSDTVLRFAFLYIF
jgi:hypothetical protein